jgi:hypothetical protein
MVHTRIWCILYYTWILLLVWHYSATINIQWSFTCMSVHVHVQASMTTIMYEIDNMKNPRLRGLTPGWIADRPIVI